MKKVFLLILLTFIFASCVACSSLQEDAKFPPTRVGSEGIVSSRLERKYTLEEAYRLADVVALVKVDSWITDDDDIFQSYYDASVIKAYKGSISESFTLLQDGSTKRTMKAYPLFIPGNEFLLFLNIAKDIAYEDAYWIMGSFTTLLDVSYDASGNMYFMDRYGLLGESVNISNYASPNPIANILYKNLIKHDPLIDEIKISYPYIFGEADLDGLFESLQ